MSIADFSFWCRDRARRDLATLERIATELEEYAEKHELITDAPSCAFGPDMWWAADLSDPRSIGLTKALCTIQEEMKWVRDQLKVFERQSA